MGSRAAQAGGGRAARGRGGGTLATGRHLAYEKNTPLTNLFTGMLKRTPVEKFSDSTGELTGLSDANFKGSEKA